MRIAFSSVFVDDQDKALKFYTEVLGFVKKTDIPIGKFKWLTVVSPGGPDDVELVLEPNENPAAKTFQKAHQRLHYPESASELSLIVRKVRVEGFWPEPKP